MVKQAILKRMAVMVASAAALSVVPGVMGVGTVAAHAGPVACVELNVPPNAFPGACPANDPALFALNICAGQADEPDALTGGTAVGPETVYTPLNNPDTTIGIAGNTSTAGVDAWAQGFPGLTPQGELEVYAAGTEAGIGSDNVGC